MTFAPRACASEMIDLPLPGSRSTSRITLAPLVSACSACVRCVPGSPWALTIVCLMPADVNAWSRYLRSNCSHRTDDCVSGSSTAMLPLTPLALVLAPPLVLDLLLEPQPAATVAAAVASATSIQLLFLGTSTSPSWPLWSSCFLNDELLPACAVVRFASPPHGRPSATRERAVGLADDEDQGAEELCPLPK